MEDNVVEPGGKVLNSLVVEEEGGQHVEILRDVRRGGLAVAGEEDPHDGPDTPDITAGQRW